LLSELQGIFLPKRDPLGGITADDVTPEIAAHLDLPDGWTEPEHLSDTLPEVARFDLELMPESLRPLVEDAAERMQVPMDFPAVASIATLAGVTNRRALIQPKRNDTSWLVVPNLWGGIVAPPGMLKSPVIAAMVKPVSEIEKAWREEYAKEEEAYRNAQELYEEDVKAWRTSYQAACKKNLDKPAKPDTSLVPPTLRRLTTSDGTFESLHHILSQNPAGLFVTRDELTGWLAGLERQGREQERSFYLECWNGDASFTIDRIGRGSIHVPHACISLFGGIQPGPLRAYMAGSLRDGSSNDGLMQRLQLLVWPDIPRGWSYVDRKPNEPAIDCAAQVYRQIVNLDCANPLRLQFDDETQPLFEHWLTELEGRIRKDEFSVSFQSHLAKYRSLMPSLALLFALADGQTDYVPISHAKQACDWCDYLESHARRLYAPEARPGQSAAIALSQRLVKGWKREDGLFTVRDVYQNGWSILNTPEAVRAALLVLTEYGWVRQVASDVSSSTGGRPSEAYRINPRVWREHVSN